MKYEDLSTEKIQEALSYLDYEDRIEWVTAAFAIKAELGQSGFEIWNAWSSQGSTYKIADARSVWRTSNASGKTKIGTLIHMAMQRGFKLGEYRPVSSHVQAERAERRKAAEKEAAIEEVKLQERYAQKAISAIEFFDKAEPCDHHEYLDHKEVGPYSNVRISDWVYKNEQGQLAKEKDALIIPLATFDKGIVSLQAIFSNGTKKILGGAQKSGSFHIIGDETDTIVITEGFATGVTVYEATGFMTFVAIDSGNLVKVAIAVRAQYPLARIIIAADNDQYKKSNTGLKAAEKACCEIDADFVFPVFKDVSSQPTDFNDLAKLEGLDAVKFYFKAPRLYFPKKNNALKIDSWDLGWVEDSKKILEESDSEIMVAGAAKIEALKMSKEVPAFKTVEQIRKHIAHPLLSAATHLSIMKQVQWSIFNRKRLVMTAIKPESWGNKHNHIVVSSLENLDITTPVTLIAAPMGAGKTKHVIKPFSKSQNFLAIAHRRSLIADLADRLNIQSYESVRSQEHAGSLERLAVCLPSTQSIILKPFIDSAYNVAIDEISQNLRFTSSKECKVQGANQDSIFLGLQKIIGESKKVVVCDASIDKTTLDFMESSRPDEKFTIIEQVPQNLGRKAFLYSQKDHFLTKIQLELSAGGKVWLAVESAEKAEILAQIFKCEKTLVVTSKTAKTINVKNFLDSIEDESRKYDLIIASPAISSGVSVEHQKPLLDEKRQQVYDEKGNPVFIPDPHFTMIAGMASGHSVCFSDFAQMLGRVRYVKDYHIHLMPNNLKNNNLTDLSILTGLRQAAAIEGGQWRETDYSIFKSYIEAREDAYKSDFANGLVWFLQYFCFKIESGMIADPDMGLALMMKELSDDRKDAYRNSLKIARKINKIEAEELNKSQTLTEEQDFALKAFKIKSAFKINLLEDLTDESIDMYENYASVRRFGYMIGLTKSFDDSEVNISLRSFERAKVEACKKIFEGFDFNFITDSACDKLIQTVSKNENRFLLSALGLVPGAYGEWKEDKSGKLKEYQIPTRSGKSVAAILDKFGMNWKRSNSRTHGNIYKVDPDQMNLLKNYATGIFS